MSEGSNDSLGGGKNASVSTAPTATVTSTTTATVTSAGGMAAQKGSLLVDQRKLSSELEQINEDVHVEDACEDDLDSGRNSIAQQRLNSY